jgi:Na+-transporting methylmalonyl-CoA/oxaloacetate decarboxylase gamma subunit
VALTEAATKCVLLAEGIKLAPFLLAVFLAVLLFVIYFMCYLPELSHPDVKRKHDTA